MAQMMPSSPANSSQNLLCYYRNATKYLQIARLENPPSLAFERLVFPGERLLFEAPADALLEIETREKEQHTSEKILCLELQVQQAT